MIYFLGGKRGTHTKEEKITLMHKGVPYFVDHADPKNFSAEELAKVKEGMSVHAVKGVYKGKEFDNYLVHHSLFVDFIYDVKGKQWIILNHDWVMMKDAETSFHDGEDGQSISQDVDLLPDHLNVDLLPDHLTDGSYMIIEDELYDSDGRSTGQHIVRSSRDISNEQDDDNLDDIILQGIERQQDERDELSVTPRLHQEANHNFSYLQSTNFDHILKIASSTSDQGISKFQDLVRLAGGGISNVIIDDSLRSSEETLIIGLMKFIKHILLSNSVLVNLSLNDIEKYSLKKLGEKSDVEAQRSIIKNFYELAKISGSSLKKMNFSEHDRMSVLSTLRKRYCLLSICSEILSRKELRLSKYDGELLTAIPSDIAMMDGSFAKVYNDKIELDFNGLDRVLTFCAGSNIKTSRSNCIITLGVSNSKFPFQIGSEIDGRLILRGVNTYTQENKAPFSDRSYETEVVSVSVPVKDPQFANELIVHLIGSNVIEISGVSASRGIGMSNRGYYSIHNGSLQKKYSKRGVAYINVVITVYPNLMSLLFAMSTNVMRMTYALAERMLHDYNANKMHEVLPFYLNGPERELLPSSVFQTADFTREVTMSIKGELDRIRDVTDVSDISKVMIFSSTVFEYIDSTMLINSMNGNIIDTEHMLFSFGMGANSLTSSIANTISTIGGLQNDLSEQDFEKFIDISTYSNDSDKLGEVLNAYNFNCSAATFIQRVTLIYEYGGNREQIDKLIFQYMRPFIANLFAFHFSFDELYDINDGFTPNGSDELKKFIIDGFTHIYSSSESPSGSVFSAGKSIHKMYSVRNDKDLLEKLKTQGSNADVSELLTMSYLNARDFANEVNSPMHSMNSNIVPQAKFNVDSHTVLSSDTIKIFTNTSNNNVFMVVRGTDPNDPHDLDLDRRIITSFTHLHIKPVDDKRMIEAQEVYDVLKKDKNAKIFILGHSLGGYIASNIKDVRKTDLILTYNRLTNVHDVKDNEISIRIKGDVPSFLAKNQSVTLPKKSRKAKKKLFSFPLTSNLINEALTSHEISQIKSEYFI